MNHYETLGVPRDASPDEVRHAYLAKAALLQPERFAGAPQNVVTAVTQAGAVVDEAWRVLEDPARRTEYDHQLEQDERDQPNEKRIRAEHIWAMERELGWPLSPVFGLEPPVPVPHADGPTARAGGDRVGTRTTDASPAGLASPPLHPSEDGNIFPLFAGLAAIADWLAPHKKAPRDVTVPDVRGMRASEAFYAVAQADLHINFIRLTENPTGGDGTVVDQAPPAGTLVRRHSTLSVHVVHPTPVAGIDLT